MPGAVDAHVHFDDPGREWWEGFDSRQRGRGRGRRDDRRRHADRLAIRRRSPPRCVEAKADGRRRAAASTSRSGPGSCPVRSDDLAAMAEAGAAGFKAFACPSGWDDFPPVDEPSLAAGCEVAAAYDRRSPCTASYPTSGPARSRRSRPCAGQPGIAAEHRAAAARRARVGDRSGRRSAPLARRHRRDVPALPRDRRREADSIGPRRACNPPIRDAANQRGLWDRLHSGAIDWIASDHSPCPPELRSRARTRGPASAVSSSRSRCPARRRRSHPVTVARLTTAAAPRCASRARARIASAATPIFALVDPDAIWTVDPGALHDRHRATPLAGRTLRGQVMRTLGPRPQRLRPRRGPRSPGGDPGCAPTPRPRVTSGPPAAPVAQGTRLEGDSRGRRWLGRCRPGC